MFTNLKDSFNLAKKVTPKRFWNLVKVTFSYFYAKYTGQPSHWGLPVSVSVEPTTTCNLGCPECPSGLRSFSRDTGSMSTPTSYKIIDQLAPYSLYMLFYFQGEPFINPRFLDMVTYAKQKGLYTATSTNAHFLHDKLAKQTVESGLDRIIISIDGTTQETYEQYRKNGKLDKVIEGTKNLIKWKKELRSSTPHVIFQFLVVRPNEHQIEEVKQLGKQLGVNQVLFKTAQVYDYKNGNPLIPLNQKYSRYRKLLDNTYEIKNNLENHCWRLWHSCVITWDGLVVPCCFDKDAQHQLGDLNQHNFKEIWRNPTYKSFRSSILRSRKEIDICANCSEGTKVWED